MKTIFGCLIALLVLSFSALAIAPNQPPLSASSASAIASNENTPNIILIVADDLGLYDLGAYGNPVIETPRLDSMANAGIRFTRAYAAAPICSPSRAATQTGLHPARIGMTEHIRGNPPTNPCWPLIPPKNMQRLAYAYRTLGEAMQDNGYSTIYVGKWHLGGGDYRPPNHGYDISYAAGGQGLPSSFFPPYFNGNPYPELNTIAGADDYLADALTTLAIEALPDDNTSPFFLDLNYYAPHVPIQGPPDLVDKYETLLGNDPDTLPRPQYAAMVEAIDRQVGRLVDTLSARDLLDNTVILFTSDHGALTVEEVPAFAAHTPPTTSGPLREGKGYLFEGGLQVPLIAYAPGRYTTMVDDNLNVNTDYFSTITSLGNGLETSLDGQPIPSLTGMPAVERELYFHFPHYSPQRGRPAGVLINQDYKLIEWYSNVDSVSLYELATDPGELNDLSTERIAETAALRQQLEAWRQSVGARYMTENDNYDPENCDD
ncbi:MAG: sulfatase [Bacteroidota bacterium]